MRKVPKLRFKEFSDKWEEKRLGDIFERITEKNTENNTNVLTISAQYGLISQTEFFNKSVAGKDLSKYYLLKKDDFAYNKSYSNGYPFGAIKKLNKYEKGIVSTLYICFRLKNRSNIVDFFEQFFESKKIDKNIQDIAQEGARNHGLLNINVQDFFDITKYTPSIQEQEKIANFLTNIDKKISLTEEKLELFREYKKGVMQKIFSQELRFKDSNGNDYPEWEEKKLGEIGDTYNGLTGKSAEDFGRGKKYITYKNIYDNTKINMNILELVNIELGEKQNKVEYGDIFFTTSSETPNEVGYSSVLLDKIQEDIYLNSFCFGFRLKNKVKYLPEFFRYLLRSSNFRTSIYILAQGSTRFNLSKVELLKLKVLLPALEEQQKIADFLSSIDSKLESIEKELEGLKEFKKGLLQQMFV